MDQITKTLTYLRRFHNQMKENRSLCLLNFTTISLMSNKFDSKSKHTKWQQKKSHQKIVILIIIPKNTLQSNQIYQTNITLAIKKQIFLWIPRFQFRFTIQTQHTLQILNFFHTEIALERDKKVAERASKSFIKNICSSKITNIFMIPNFV